MSSLHMQAMSPHQASVLGIDIEELEPFTLYGTLWRVVSRAICDLKYYE